MFAHPRRPAFAVLLVALLPCAARTAGAQTVVVPDDYPTIQAAINSPATRILVREGTYAENLTVGRPLSLEPLPHGWDGEYTPNRDAHPRIAGSVALGPSSGSPLLSLVGFHVTGQVTVSHSNSTSIKVAECEIDGGIARQGGEPINLSIRGCIVRGGINASGVYGDMTGNTVLGVGITTSSSAAGCCMAVLDNYVVGPAAIGISFHDGGTKGVITGNTVTGCQKGIVITGPDGAEVADNVVMDCTGNGYEVIGDPEYTSLSVTANTALRCGNNGFDLYAVRNLSLVGNEADDCGGHGIRLVRGVGFGAPPPVATDNRVLRAGADGIHADGAALMSRNIVGRSRDRGIVVASPDDGLALDHNTSYWNGRAGFELSSPAGGTITSNISYANQHEGLVWSGAAPALACNDWFANVSGATSGTAPGVTDLAVDPLFCNLPADDVHIATFSPLHNAPGCGLIGALDIGCSEPTGVSLPAARGSFLARPQPTKGALRFEWVAQASPGEIEVYDATGARRWQAKVSPGSSGLDWRGADTAGNALPSGIYFARLSRGGRVEMARVVIAR